MERYSTLFLKIAIFIIGTPVLVLCIFWLPRLAKGAAESNSEFAYAMYGILAVCTYRQYLSLLHYIMLLNF